MSSRAPTRTAPMTFPRTPHAHPPPIPGCTGNPAREPRQGRRVPPGRFRELVPRIARRAALLLALVDVALGLATGGCASGPGRVALPRPAATAIRELHLFGLPTALNLDAIPGADGVVVKLYAAAPQQPKAVPIAAGVLELVAYDGPFDPARPLAPFHAWRFEAADLVPHKVTTVLGTGYDLVLSWTPKRLAHDRVTVVARWHPPRGPVVTSAPSTIAASSF